jgi:YqaJ-like recombinase protein
MSVTVFNVEQRSPEWFALRAGKLTSTCAADMLATLKSGGEAAGRRNLRVRLALERMAGRSLERDFTSRAMQDGADREADAYAAYEALTGQLLSRTGFVALNEYQAGCSLDGHAGDFEGLIEIKAPIHATHWEYLRTGTVPGDYLKQVQHAMWITGAKWCDWLSYHPDFPPALQVKLVRVARDESAIADYERKALAFLAEVQREYEAITTMADFAAQLQRAAEVTA